MTRSKIIINASEVDRMHEHVRQGYPHEVVGILAGHRHENRVTHIRPLVNERQDTPHRRYLVSGLVLFRAEQEMAEQQLDLIGTYHSHPDHSAQYSDFDREHAMPNISYVIVSVVRGKVVETLSWRLLEDRSAMQLESIEKGE